MRELLFATLFMLGLCACPLAAQDDSLTAQQVLAAEDRRLAAMLARDTATLRPLLADELAYTHTSGRLESRAEFLRSLGSGALRYEAIAPEERSVRLYGRVAVVVGRSAMRAGPIGEARAFRIRYLAVYINEGGRWLLGAWQSTIVPP
ncbi:MAG: nuclear transport factor 2 family protein [Gemmatimonadales bacterium]